MRLRPGQVRRMIPGMSGAKLASGLTPQQEHFVELLLDGHTQTDAYRLAYNCSNMRDSAVRGSASQLANQPIITNRLAELRARNTYVSDWKTPRVIREASDTYLAARAADDYSASLAALRLIAQLNGLIVTQSRSEVTHISDTSLSQLTLDELRILVREADQRLSLAEGKVIESTARELPPQS